MRVLISGATGLLGRVLVEDLAGLHEVTALTHSSRTGRFGVNERALDLTDLDALRTVWQEVRPELVVHTAAVASLEECEADPERARMLNTEVVGQVAQLCADHKSRLVHISTDAVFSGEGGPFRESDTPAPQNAYAETKLAGEEACLEALPEALVARVNFFGWSLSGRRSLAEFFYNSLVRNMEVGGYTDVEFASLYNRDLATVLIQASAAGISGVRHIVSSDSMSKYEFGRSLARTFGLDPELVQPSSVDVTGSSVRRTRKLTLSSELIGSELGRPLPTIQEGLLRMRRDLDSGYVWAMRGSTRPDPKRT